LAAIGSVGYSKYQEYARKTVILNNIDLIDKAFNSDLASFVAHLKANSTLLDGISSSNPTCEEMAIQAVINLNKVKNNPFDESLPAAGYGNYWDGSAIPKGTIVISCKDDQVQSTSSNFLIYECVDDAQNLEFTPGDNYAPGNCPQPKNTGSNFFLQN
jgi:hypothetical protein